MDKFKASWALFAEIYRRDRSEPAAFFELGQAEFWIGYVHLDRGELGLAETAFLSYAEITRRLIQLQPRNAEWVLEMAYALTNLGRVQITREGSNPERTLQYMQSALEYNQLALVLDPESEYYQSELGQSHANLADAQLSVCDLDGALHSRQQGVTLETGLLEQDSDNPERQSKLALALTGLAGVQVKLGHNDDAMDNYEQSLQLIETSARPGQEVSVTTLLTERKNLIIRLYAMNGRIDEAWETSMALSEDWQKLLDAGQDDVYTLNNYSTYLLNHAWLANERGDADQAMLFLEKGISPLVVYAAKFPENRVIGNGLTRASYRYWEITGELPSDSILSLLPNYRAKDGRTRACLDASLAVRKDIMLGKPAQSDDLVAYLLNKGFRESSFMGICRLYYDCSGEKDSN